MRFDRISRQADQLNASFCKFGLEFCKRAQLGGANGSIIFGMGEKDGPLVANPFMEIDGARRGLGLEVGRN